MNGTVGRFRPWPGGILAFVGIVLLALSPLFLDPSYVTILLFSFLFLVLAANYDLVGGYLGYVNLGQGAFFGIGAYVVVVLLNNKGMETLGAPAIIIATVVGLALTVLFAAATSFPLFRLKGAYFAIVTITLVLLLQILVVNFPNLTGGSFGIYVPTQFYMDKYVAFYLALALASGSVLMNYLISRSSTGLAFKCIREDEEAAAAVGINTFRHKQLGLVLSSAPSSLAGTVFALSSGYIDHEMALGLERTLLPPMMAMLGGTGLVMGPVLGTAIVRAIDIVVFHYVSLPIPSLLFYGLILMFIGLFMPEGVLSSPRITGIFKRGASVRAAPAAAPTSTLAAASDEADPKRSGQS
ncbi:MAG: branched-chain amino acid ABC transporter permease [Dehalococcoidia bacterium]|nr:branched-chain amino acid ABC transporter permease [Dehalococcoidia bacterium]